MILTYIALAGGISTMFIYFIIKDNKRKKNPLGNIRFKDISLGENKEKGKVSSQNGVVTLSNGGSGKFTTYIKNIYKNIVKNHRFFDYVSRKKSNFSKETK